MKMTLLAFLVVTMGYLSHASSTNVEITSMSNPVLTVVDTNGPSAKEITQYYVDTARDYEQHPEYYKVDELFLVARGYLAQTNYNKAIPLYKKFLTAQPTNIIAILDLGVCYVWIKKYDEAASQFKKAWLLGDDRGLKSLGNVYVLQARFSDIKPLVPDLFKARERETDNDYKHEATNLLLYYSIYASASVDKDIFFKAINGLSDKFILERKDTSQLVISGLRTFGYKERADKLAAEMKKTN